MKEVLLIGSGNKDKTAELAGLLAGLPWEIKCLADFPQIPEPTEDGDTLEANALKKARYYGSRFDVSCVADDSGLSVDALDGGPGVLSARYAGATCTYADNNAKLLEALEGVAEQDRAARFVCCAAFVDRAGESHIAIGTVEGRIAIKPRGNNGFGYDPLFIPDGHDKTFGELDKRMKQHISHRARAFRELRAYLESLR